MTRHVTVSVDSARYADHDDCLAAAAEEYAADHGMGGYDLEPRWDGGDEGERERILLTVPAWTQEATTEGCDEVTSYRQEAV
jgi:hypothetical protein